MIMEILKLVPNCIIIDSDWAAKEDSTAPDKRDEV